MIRNNDFHQFRTSQDSRAGLDRERVLYDTQPIVTSSQIGAKPSSPPIDGRLLFSLVKFRDRDIPVNPPLGASSNHQTELRAQSTRDSIVSEIAIGALPGLHASEFPSRIGFPPPHSSLLLPQQTPMEHDLFQDRPSQSSDQPTAVGNYGSSSEHMGTATSNVNLTASNASIDPSGASYSPVGVPRGRPPRLGTSASNYHPMHRQQLHATPQQSTQSPTSTAYYTAQQTQSQNSGGQPQHQHYMTQPMSPTIYYPTFSHMHQQGGSPNAYNVNQGYMGPVSTSAGPSMSVTTYAYSHPYAAHVSDHTLHPFAYPGPVGGVSTGLYPELDPQAHQQQMQNRSGSVDMMAGYVPVMTTTAPPFAYGIPAYAPTGGSIFTPQYTGSHPYNYAPQQTQPFPAAYGQTHQGPSPPPLNPSRQQGLMQGSSHVGLDHPPGSPSPLMFPNTNQGTSSGYSPITVSPAPGSNPPRRLDFIGRRASGPSPFGLGLNPGINIAVSPFGSDGVVSSGDTFSLDRSGTAVDSTCSTIPAPVDLVGPGSDGNGAQTQEPSSSQQDRERTTHGIATPNRQDRPDQQQTSTKGERSEWVMWVGNVPGDASLNELYSFFGQGPPISEEERIAAGGKDLASIETLPQVEGVALEPTTRDETDVARTDIGVGVGGLSGVVSVFLISRSNCAFVNYVSEASLQRGVDYFNGRPLRNPQVDPRCPKLVCRVRKKGDDVKAGVGGQRGVGTHTRWVKEQKAGETANLPTITSTEGDDGPMERPPFVRGGPAGNAKKSSSGSSGSYASTTSSMLMRHFPNRYFILKSLTQHDLDLSVERGLWATQVHNQEVLDQAYRTSQTVYLVFGVNKSGEFFGYAKMESPISQVERTPSIEWASRDSLVNAGTAKLSPAAVRGVPSQPTIQEEKERENPEQEEQQRLDLTLPSTEDKKPSVHSSNDATTRGDKQRQDLPRSSSVPFNTSDPAKHENLQYHQGSEPIRPRQHEVYEGPAHERFARHLPSMSSRSPEQPASVVSPTSRIRPSMAHLWPGATLQESPDPLTPGEDQKLHSLNNSLSSGRPKESERGSSRVSVASAPAIMGRGYTPLSASSPAMPSDTWDEARKGVSMWTKEHSIEEEFEGGEDIVEPPSVSQSLPPQIHLASVEEAEQPNQPPGLEIPASPLALSHLDTPDIHPIQPKLDEAEDATTRRPKDERPVSDAPVMVGGREEGWGTPFRIKWLRTDPLPFHRTRHLRNPWNHDREIKVSRDGTEIEPGVGQRLLEEWERAETGPIAGRAALSPTSLRIPPSPTQAFIPRGRGRGRGAMTGGWVQRDTGQ